MLDLSLDIGEISALCITQGRSLIMMVNCPKCGFLQDKDVYCANCGVNMETYKPPKTPVIKKLLSNWIAQLAILLIIVFVIVLRDSFTSSKTPRSVEAPRPRQIERAETNSFQETSERQRPQQVRKRERAPKKAKNTAVAPSQKPETSSNTNKEPYGPLKQNINARVYLASRIQIESLVNNSQKIDEGIGYVPVASFNKATSQNKQDWKRADSIRKSFQFNRPSILFIGERSTESDKNIGFYFEVTVFDTSDNNTISFELRSWNELKAAGGQEDAISYEFSLPRGELAVISGLVSKDQGFTEDERALFDSSSSLRVLNNEAFVEDYSDIVLVLQLN